MFKSSASSEGITGFLKKIVKRPTTAGEAETRTQQALVMVLLMGRHGLLLLLVMLQLDLDLQLLELRLGLAGTEAQLGAFFG